MNAPHRTAPETAIPRGSRRSLPAVLALAALVASSLFASPGAAQEGSGEWTGTAQVAATGHGDGPSRFSGSYPMQLSYILTREIAGGNWGAEFWTGNLSSPSMKVYDEPDGVQFLPEGITVAGDNAFANGTCNVTLAVQTETAVEGTVACTGPTAASSVQGETMDLTGSFSVKREGAAGGGGCIVEGTVTDRVGAPVAGAHLRLDDPSRTAVEDVATGADGRYRFAARPTALMKISVLAEEYAHAPGRFQLFAPDVIPGVRTDVDPSGGASCRRDFPVAALPGGYQAFSGVGASAPDIFEIYQELQQGWAATSRFDHSVSGAPGLPLRVFAWCTPGRMPLGTRCPVGRVPAWFTQEAVSGRPYIAIQPGFSAIDQGVTPAETVHHEFGHFYLWAAFGALRHHPDNTNHAGYYKNPSSADAWTEGFATFFAEMVRKHVAKEGSSRFESSSVKPWDLAGISEELAVVAALLDLEDGTSDYAAAPGSTRTPKETITFGDGAFTARFGNDVPVGTPWVARGVDPPSGSTAGTIVERDGGRVAIGRVPGANRVRIEARIGLGSADDDPIDGDLPVLWSALFDHRSEAPQSNGHTFDVFDVYLAAGRAYNGDRDGDGADDVDEVFISHGLFADVAGGVSNIAYDAGEDVGLTSHFERELGPTFNPRRAPPAIPELVASIDTGGIQAAALVQVSFDAPNEASSFSTVVAPGGDGTFDLGLPPPRAGAQVSVIMLADGYAPAVALDMPAQEFWQQADASPGTSFLSAQVDLVKAAEWKSWAFTVILAAIAAAVLATRFARRNRARRALLAIPPPPAPTAMPPPPPPPGSLPPAPPR
ncbi:MAG: carboxypeptidase-like regulatory domain-containing protein [Actinomycetota bacterium]